MARPRSIQRRAIEQHSRRTIAALEATLKLILIVADSDDVDALTDALVAPEAP